MPTVLTVFFEDPFWVGVLEWREERQVKAARIIFGSEPSAPEVYALVLRQYQQLAEGASSLEAPFQPPRPPNPKRAARQAAAARIAHGPSTYAQEALKRQVEQNKQARRIRSRAEREAQQERRAALARQKARDRHRGR